MDVSWTIKKAECRRINAFELWCWRRLLRVPWTARRLNQSILKEIKPGYSLEGLMLKLKLQYFGHLMRRADSLEKTLMLRPYCLHIHLGENIYHTKHGFLRVPSTARRSNQSILKEVSPEYSLEGLKLKRQYSGHLMQRTD